MLIKSVMLLLVVLLPFSASAAKGDFDFMSSGETLSFNSECIESIHYVDKDEVDAENLSINLTDACGKKLSTMTRQNIGKQMSITYNGNKLTSALIASRLSTSFRISTKDTPRVLLMQVLDDYGYFPE
ncbi:Insecticidal toxin complex protein tccz [Erwinia sp. P7711]|uniref:SecDF P1 head subdomain-containing protein n=1 Tax=Erwinia sp. P7711 TaxID=3141451 RepID=UPI0031893631